MFYHKKKKHIKLNYYSAVNLNKWTFFIVLIVQCQNLKAKVIAYSVFSQKHVHSTWIQDMQPILAWKIQYYSWNLSVMRTQMSFS